MPGLVLTPSQLRILLWLYSQQSDDGGDVRPPGPDARYANGAYRRLVQRGLVSESGNLTPAGIREAHRRAARLRRG